MTAGWEVPLARLGFKPSRDPAVDFESLDGSRVVEVLDRKHVQIRELRSRVTGLGVLLARRPRVRQACLVVPAERVSEDRLRQEWDQLCSILRPAIADRLALVALGEDFDLCLPERTGTLVDLVQVARPLLLQPTAVELPPQPKFFAVLKVLLVRWLLGQGAISRGELGELAGCSYPTTAKALQRLGRTLSTRTKRGVELRDFPRVAWKELLALAPTSRGSMFFADTSGRSPDPEGLRRRLARLRPSHVALGGVLAAQHWDPHFDLHGLPRLDLLVHAAPRLDVGFLQQLDPALQPADSTSAQAVLVVHPLRRPATLFAEDPGGSLPIADPVETLLDLAELRLDTQAEELIERLRQHAGGSS